MTELTLQEGWVSKKSSQMRLSRHAWQKRFTTLKQQSLVLASERLNKYILFFYKTPPSTSKEKSKPIEHILVQDVVRVHMFGHETGRFNLSCRGQKLLELKTESDAETLKWCSSLCSHIKLAWIENKKDKVSDSAYQEVIRSQDRDKALSLLATGSFFWQHHDAGQREQKEGQSEEKERIGSEKEFVFCFWNGGEGPGGLVCAEPRVAAKAGTAPKPVPIDSIKEIRLGKQTKPWLSPLASQAVDLHCISFISSVSPIHLEGASPEQVHWVLYCVALLLSRCGKKLIEEDAGHFIVADPKTLKPKGEGARPPPTVDVATMDFPSAVLKSNKQKDKFQALISLEERFEGKVKLVQEGRVLVHQGKLGIKGTFTDSTYLFLLCNDILICASTGLGALTWKLTTKFVAKIDEYFSVNNLLDGTKKSERNQFRIVTVDKTYVIQAKDADDKKEWMGALRKVIKTFKSSEEQKQKRKAKKLETEAQIKAEKEDRKREEAEAAAVAAHTKRMQQLQFEKLIEEEKGITNTEIIDDSMPDADDLTMEGIEGRIEDPEDSEVEEGEPHPGKGPKILTPVAAGSSRTVISAPSPVAATSPPRLDPSSSKSQLQGRSQPDLQALLAEATALLEDGLPGPPSPAPSLKPQSSVSSLGSSSHPSSHPSPHSSPHPSSSPSLKPQSSVSSLHSTPSKSRLDSPAARGGKPADGFIPGPPPEPDEPLPPLPSPGGSRPVSPAPGLGRIGSLTQLDQDSPGEEQLISVTEWLTKLGKAFMPYAKAFEENGVDMRFLYSGDLTEDDLDELGVKSKIHRKKIMFTIETEIQERQKVGEQT